MSGDEAKEWSDAADWCAREDSLPDDLSDRVRVEIEMCPDGWAEAIRMAAYARDMEAIERNQVIDAEVAKEGDV